MANKNYTSLDRTKPDKYLIFTLLLMVFSFLANSLWIYLNQNPLDFDPIGHTFASLNSAEYIKMHLFNNFNLGDFMRISPGYPNFVHIASLPLIYFFGNSWKIIEFTGTIFLLVSIIAIFLYVRQISKNSRIAFFSAFFYSFFISIVQYSRFHMLDIPLTAMVLLTMYFWEKFKTSDKYVYFYAGIITMGFAQITKWHAFIFLLIPGLFLLFYLYKSKKLFSGKFVFHLLIMVLILIVIVVPWYYYNFASFLRLGMINYKGEPDDPKNMLNLANILYYPKVIINFQTHFLGLLFFIFSCLRLQIRKNKYLVLPLLTLIFSYIFFTFFVINKNIRVLFAIMPFISLIMAVGAERIIVLTKKNFLSLVLKLFLSGITLYFVFSYFVLSFGFPIKPDTRVSYPLPILGWIDLVYLKTYPVNLLYSQQPIAYEKIIKDMISRSESKKPIKVLIGVHLLYFHSGILSLEIYDQERNELNKAYDILTNKVHLYDVSSLDNNQSFLESLQGYDVIFTTEKNPINKEDVLNSFYQPIKNIQNYLLGDNNYEFIRGNTYQLPDGDRLIIFVRL